MKPFSTYLGGTGTFPILRVLLWLGIIFGILPTTGLTQSALEEGKKWYRLRAQEADSFRAAPNNINYAIQSFKEHQQQEPSPQLASYLLKSYYFKGMYTGLEEDLQKKVFERAREYGEQMMKRYPNSVAVKFWYAANLGQWAARHDIISSAASGVAGKLRRVSEDIIALDPEYLGGGGYRILAQVHFHAPNIPLVLGWPSDKKALKLVQQAIGVAPNHPSNRLLYAQILLEFDAGSQARMHVDFLAKRLVPRSTHLAEDRYVKYQAQQLLREHFEE